jgi:hypothetical protein
MTKNTIDKIIKLEELKREEMKLKLEITELEIDIKNDVRFELQKNTQTIKLEKSIVTITQNLSNRKFDMNSDEILRKFSPKVLDKFFTVKVNPLSKLTDETPKRIREFYDSHIETRTKTSVSIKIKFNN